MFRGRADPARCRIEKLAGRAAASLPIVARQGAACSVVARVVVAVAALSLLPRHYKPQNKYAEVCGQGVPCCGCSYCFPQKFTCTVSVKLTDDEYRKSESSWWIARLRRRFRGSGTASPHFWDGFGLFCFPTLCTYTDYLLKTNDALSPAPDRFPQVSFRLRLVSFGHDHHVLRTRNRACIAWPRDFIVPASNVVLHHLKKRSRKTMFSAIKLYCS